MNDPDNSTKLELLRSSLAVAVPLWIDRWKSEGKTLDDLLPQASAWSQIIAEKGDIILYRSKKKGETAAAFNALAQAIALMSLMPGGIKVFDVRFENVLSTTEP